MNQEIKRAWVAALRSGQYTQGQHVLKQNSEEGLQHCCLGVLCEVMEAPAKQDGGLFLFDGESQGLSYGLRNKAGLTVDEAVRLWQMNDGVGPYPTQTFNQIAEYIERNL